MSERDGTGRPFGFKRHGLKQTLGLLMLSPFVAVALGSTVVLLNHWRVARLINAHQAPSSFLGVPDGPTRNAGAISRAAVVTSPLGATGAGWAGAIGYIATYKRRARFEPLCVRGDLTELELKDATPRGDPLLAVFANRTVQVTFAKPDLPLTFAPTATSSDRPMVAIGALAGPDAPVPEAMRGWCGGVRAPHDEALVYREDVLPQGAHVEVLGCARGSAIVRCDDDVDLFTTGSIAERQAKARSDEWVTLLFGALWNLGIVTAISLIAMGSLVRSRLSLREGAERA